MIQEILVILAFIGALGYLGRVLYKQFQAKAACASGCSKCSAVDFKKIEADLKSKGL
jgi:FeoB-associated Cys-rich membrane protein